MLKNSKILIALLIILIGYLFYHNMRKPTDQQSQALAGSHSLLNTEHNVPVPQMRVRSWSQFSPPSGDFKVLLPSKPQHLVDENLDPKNNEKRKYHTFISTDDEGPVFMVSQVTYSKPLDVNRLGEILQETVKEMVTRNKTNVLKEMKMSNDLHPKSIDFSLLNGEVLISGKIYVDNDTLYILTMINQNDAFSFEDFSHFINSFSIKQDGK